MNETEQQAEAWAMCHAIDRIVDSGEFKTNRYWTRTGVSVIFSNKIKSQPVRATLRALLYDLDIFTVPVGNTTAAHSDDINAGLELIYEAYRELRGPEYRIARPA